MKKDKAFAEKGELARNYWHIGYEPPNHILKRPYSMMAIRLEYRSFEVYPGQVKQLCKFIKALKKGLRRLER